MSLSQKSEALEEPFPIFSLAHKYLIYDPNVIAHVREVHNICGVLIGSLPQAPQQNVFLGIPLALMPEEARLLVEKGAAFLVDDTKAHKSSYLDGDLSSDDQKAYHDALRRRGLAAAEEANRRTEERKQAALRRKVEKDGGDWNDIPDDMLRPSTGQRKRSGTNHIPMLMDEAKTQENVGEDNEALFSTTQRAQPEPDLQAHRLRPVKLEPYAITPTTSQPPLHFSVKHGDQELPTVPPSYPLFKHMHSQGYFLAPGLRFGCQYMAYPGDPLRFHSHFLCDGMEWDREFDLLDIVGGGRLGTGVKKGFLIGGQASAQDESRDGDSVRAFTIEWAGM